MSDPFAEVNDDASIEGLDATFVELDGVTDQVDGISTRYYDYGDGDPLILLHGGGWIGSSNANTWSRVIKQMSDHFRVLAVDRVACGMTGNPPCADDFVYDTELEHVISFLSTLDIDEFHICGQSRGGRSRGHGDGRDPRAGQNPDCRQQRDAVSHLPHQELFFARALSEQAGGEPTLRDHIDQYRERYEVHEYSPDYVTEEFVKAAAYMRTRPKAIETAEIWDNGGEEQWSESLLEHMSYVHLQMQKGNLQMPMLVYWGRNDPSVPVMSGIGLYELMARENPRVRMEILSRAGHHPYREYPEEFVERIGSFVDLHEEYGYDYAVPETAYDAG